MLVGVVQMASTIRSTAPLLPLWTVASQAAGTPGGQMIQSDSAIVTAGSTGSVIAPPPVTTMPPGHPACAEPFAPAATVAVTSEYTRSTGPGGPCGPRGPTVPVGPEGPVAPCGPIEPAGPRRPRGSWPALKSCLSSE